LLFNINIESITAISEDDYSDFFIQNFTNNNFPSTMENVNGIPYTSRVIKSLALFAHQSGDYTIDPFVLDAGVEAPFAERRGFFSMRNLDMTKVASAPRIIHVLPLPPGAPQGFSGAVGQYSVKQSVGQTGISTDDALTITLDVTGNGDSKRWDPPAPVVDGDFEIYDPKITQDRMVEEQGHISHRRTIEYQMIPRAPGQYNVVIPLIYFNPQTLKYETAQADTIHLNVRQGIKKISSTSVAETPLVALPLRKVHNITSDDRFWLSIPHLFVFGLLVSGSFWGMLVSFKRRREERIPEGDKIRAAAVSHARHQVDSLQADSVSLQDKEYFERATEIFYKFVSDKLSIPAADLDLQKLNFYLDRSIESAPVKEKLAKFFEQCLAVRYGAIPGNMSRDEMLAQIRDFIDKV
ncbi:MAG: BatD family protein, partial [Saprospiraceae bacterium]